METIKVVVRLRPFLCDNNSQLQKPGWRTDPSLNLIECTKLSLYDKPFTFDQVFTGTTTNEELYATSVQDMITQAFNGIDTTVFAYGQTGAGKTHTVLGQHDDLLQFNGILFLALHDIFTFISNKPENEEYVVTCSYIEIYNEQVYDLLNKPENFGECLQIFEDQKHSKFKVTGTTKVRVQSISEVQKILAYGEANRTYGETCFNLKSSRSHTIFTIDLKMTSYQANNLEVTKESTINMVDLAGNERLLFEQKEKSTFSKKTDTLSEFSSKRSNSILKNKNQPSMEFKGPNEKDGRIVESKNINKSLFFLTQVIYLCARQNPATHIPFRNSSLTKILRSSFGGTSRTLLILCLSPNLVDADVSLSSLRFGRCAKKIENSIKANVVSTGGQIQADGAVVQKYQEKIVELTEQIKLLEINLVPVPDFTKFIRETKKFVGFETVSNLIEKQQKIENEIYEIQEFQKRSSGNFRGEIVDKNAGLLFFEKNKFIDLKNCVDNYGENFCQKCKLTETEGVFKMERVEESHNRNSELQTDFKNNVIGFLEQIDSMFEIWKEQFSKLLLQTQNLKNNLTDFTNAIFEEFEQLKVKINVFEDLSDIELLSEIELENRLTKVKNITKKYTNEILRRKIYNTLESEDPFHENRKRKNDLINSEKKAQELDFSQNLSFRFNEIFGVFTDDFTQIQEMLKEEVNISYLIEQTKQDITHFSNEIKDSNFGTFKLFNMFLKDEAQKSKNWQNEILWMKNIHKFKNILETKNQKDDLSININDSFSSLRDINLSPNNSTPLFEISQFPEKVRPLLKHALFFHSYCKFVSKNELKKQNINSLEILPVPGNSNSKINTPLKISPDKISEIFINDKIGDFPLQSIAEKVRVFKEKSSNIQKSQEKNTPVYNSVTEHSTNKNIPLPLKPKKINTDQSVPITQNSASDFPIIKSKKGLYDKIMKRKNKLQEFGDDHFSDNEEKNHVSLNSSGFLEESPIDIKVIPKQDSLGSKKVVARDSSRAKPVLKDSGWNRLKSNDNSRGGLYALQREKQKMASYNSQKKAK